MINSFAKHELFVTTRIVVIYEGQKGAENWNLVLLQRDMCCWCGGTAMATYPAKAGSVRHTPYFEEILFFIFPKITYKSLITLESPKKLF